MYPESLEESEIKAKKAFSKIKLHSLKCHPNNFAIWYEFFGGRYKDLQTKIDQYEKSEKTLDDKTCEELYVEFFTFQKEHENVLDISGKITDSIGSIGDQVSAVLKSSSALDNALEYTSKKIETISTITELKDIISDLVKKNKDVYDQNKKFIEIAEKTNQDILGLKKELEDSYVKGATDSLTGLGNYKLFQKKLINFCDIARSSNSALCVLFVDIDNFNAFNKSHGLKNGDLVLRFLARILMKIFGEECFIARAADDEFAIILPKEDLKSAKDKAERMRILLAQNNIINKATGEDLGKITVSVGLADYNNEGSLHLFLERVKSALFVARQSGCNRVVCQNRKKNNQFE
ncbi:MAG: GGDEF domain-containing protein [Alphaproteobacteria bacterium]|nr:GGDEF domain-containing protein [Alphaproteobacteria bacterium]